MKQKNKNNFIKASLAIGIALAFLMPVTITTVSAIDTTPPQFSSPYFDPLIYVGSLADSYVYAYSYVDDDVAIADVRYVVNGPDGFYSNESIGFPYSEGVITPLPSYGTYASYLWAVDTSGNQAVTETFYSYIYENYLNYVHVQSGTPFPWDGSAAHPFPTINMGLMITAPYGTVFVHNGVYNEYIYPVNVTIIGENKNNVILQQNQAQSTITINSYNHVNISNMTIANANGNNTEFAVLNIPWGSPSYINFRNCIVRNNTNGFFLIGPDYVTITNCDITNNEAGITLGYGTTTSNEIITNCNIHDNTYGIYFVNPIVESNQIYHNNFINNTHNVYLPYGGNVNTWDTGITGNYWDNYRAVHPNAHVIPATGTWDAPYTINANNIDHHPWVYPNGFIDMVAPTVTVTYPSGGETVNGPITVTWTATDDMTHNLSGKIGVSYSADAGSTWHTIASHIANSGSYVWDTNTVTDGTQYLIKVNASDDFQNLGFDVSNGVFTILNHPNQAPDVPRQPTGPASGYVGVEYTFTTNTTDPNNDQVYYKWSWGAEESDWMGPYASGATVSVAHTWTIEGAYDVKVKAKDTSNVESDWSKELPVTVTIQQLPVLTIEQFKGGFGLSAVVKNTGNAPATNVSWTINLDGKMIFLGKNTTGTITSIAPGDSVIIKTGLVLGFGKTNIVATATCAEGATYTEDGSAFVLLFFVVGVTEPLP
jgi:hypothetical protein